MIENQADRLESLFLRAGSGDPEAFAEWMSMVEHPLRRSLARFARVVDVEVVAQETFLRMWIFACDPERRLDGEDASLRFALRVAWNVAHEEIRRARPGRFVPEAPEDLPGRFVTPSLPDPFLKSLIEKCFERLPSKPRAALEARVRDGGQSDRDLAAALRMKLNTFLQNIVRARKFMADCLERQGVRLGEILS